jgi:hypothetical protein
MNQYSYRFEKSPKKKGKCPKCGQANTFRYYEERRETVLMNILVNVNV